MSNDALQAQLAALEEERDALAEKIEAAAQAMAETQSSWERPCHAIMAALDLDFGGPTPDIPEENSWYALNLKRAEAAAERAEAMQAEILEAALFARNRLEMIADESWHGDGRDLKRAILGIFTEFDDVQKKIRSPRIK